MEDARASVDPSASLVARLHARADGLARVPAHLVALAVGGPVVALLMLLTAADVAGHVALWENAHWTASAALAAVLAGIGARRAGEDDRQPRQLIFGTTLLWLGGQIAWDIQTAIAYYDIPAPSDVGYLGAMAPAFLALALLVRGRRSVGEELAVYLDSAAIFLSLTAFVVALNEPASLPPEVSVFVLLYPIVHLAAAGGGFMALMSIRAAPSLRGAWVVLLGVAVLGVAWVDWLREAVIGLPPPGGAVGFAFSLGIILVGAGGATWSAPGRASGTSRRLAELAVWLLPAGAVGASLTLLLLRSALDRPPGLAELAATGAITVGAVRQALLLRERNDLVGRQQAVNEELERALVERAESDALYRALVENVPAAVYVDEHDEAISDGGRLVYVSPAIADIVGYAPDELIGNPELFASRVHPDDVDRVNAALAEQWRAGSPLRIEYRMLARDGSLVWVRDQADVVVRADGRRIAQGVLVDASDQKRLEAQLVHDARHDPLTGLANRTLIRERLGERLASRRRRSPIAVLFFDMDDFKIVNDTLGHEVGDALLVEVGRRLRGATRAGDIAGRLGGDEFTVLLGGVGDAEDAVAFAERILAEIRRPVEIEGRRLVVSASVGITVASPGEARIDDALAEADMALYEAKAQGKGRHALFDPAMRERAWARLDLESDLRAGIDRGEFEVWYQPIVELPSRRIVAVEALVRWRHPRRGLIGPDAFIPIAEATGLIVPLGQLVLDEACRRVRGWQRSNPEHAALGLAVNLSTRQAREPGLPGLVRHALEATGLDAAHLTLEVTETLLLDGPVADECVAELHALGVALSIDDFGTGFAGLEYVKRLAVAGLKVDRSFVAGLGRDAADSGIVAATIALAKGLDLLVTAEGVETEEQLAELVRLGCGRGQGYLFARPAPAEAIDALLAGRARISDAA